MEKQTVTVCQLKQQIKNIRGLDTSVLYVLTVLEKRVSRSLWRCFGMVFVQLGLVFGFRVWPVPYTLTVVLVIISAGLLMFWAWPAPDARLVRKQALWRALVWARVAAFLSFAMLVAEMAGVMWLMTPLVAACVVACALTGWRYVKSR